MAWAGCRTSYFDHWRCDKRPWRHGQKSLGYQIQVVLQQWQRFVDLLQRCQSFETQGELTELYNYLFNLWVWPGEMCFLLFRNSVAMLTNKWKERITWTYHFGLVSFAFIPFNGIKISAYVLASWVARTHRLVYLVTFESTNFPIVVNSLTNHFSLNSYHLMN